MKHGATAALASLKTTRGLNTSQRTEPKKKAAGYQSTTFRGIADFVGGFVFPESTNKQQRLFIVFFSVGK